MSDEEDDLLMQHGGNPGNPHNSISPYTPGRRGDRMAPLTTPYDEVSSFRRGTPIFMRTPDASNRRVFTPSKSTSKTVRTAPHAAHLMRNDITIGGNDSNYDPLGLGMSNVSNVMQPQNQVNSNMYLDDRCKEWIKVVGIAPGAVGERYQILMDIFNHRLNDRDDRGNPLNSVVRIKESAGPWVLLRMHSAQVAKLAAKSHNNKRLDATTILSVEVLDAQTCKNLQLEVNLKEGNGIEDFDIDIDNNGVNSVYRASNTSAVLSSNRNVYAAGGAGAGGLVNRGQRANNGSSAGGSSSSCGLRMIVGGSNNDPNFNAVREVRRDSWCDKIMQFFNFR